MTFPFFRLPADIRMEIYTILLGGKTLHFNENSKELGNAGLFLCRATESDDAFFDYGRKPTFFRSLGQREGHKLLSARHLPCYRDWEGLQLRLLQTCWQIYLEASAIPFKENCFTFPGIDMTRRLFKRLKPWQAASIQSITLYQQNGQPHWFRYGIPQNLNTPREYIRPLTGLRYLRVFIELHPEDMALLSRRRSYDRIADIDIRIGAMGDLASTDIWEVEVGIIDAIIPVTAKLNTRYPPDRPSKELADMWTKDIRFMMKGRNSDKISGTQ